MHDKSEADPQDDEISEEEGPTFKGEYMLLLLIYAYRSTPHTLFIVCLHQ